MLDKLDNSLYLRLNIKSKSMSAINTQIAKESSGLPKIAIGVLLAILLFGIFIVGYDQGQLFSLAQGQQAYDDLWMHEFYHDLRHAAGFPCH